MVLVGWWGPTYLARYGLSGWKGALLMGLAIVLLLKALGSYERRHLARATSR